MTCGSDRTIKLWRPCKLLQLKHYKGHSAEVTDCQAKADNSQFVSCSNDKSVISWDVETGKILRRFRNMAPFNTITYGHEGSTVFAGSVDGSVRIYDLRALNAWEPIQNLTEASDGITCCRIYKHQVFTTSLDKSLRIYDIRQGKLSINTFHTKLNHVSLSLDGLLAVIGCLRGSILLYNIREGKILNKFKGNENKLFKLESSFAMKDTLVVGGSENGRVYLWDYMAINSEPKLALVHPANLSPPIIQSVSSDSLDYLLTACAGHMFLWSLG